MVTYFFGSNVYLLVLIYKQKFSGTLLKSRKYVWLRKKCSVVFFPVRKSTTTRDFGSVGIVVDVATAGGVVELSLKTLFSICWVCWLRVLLIVDTTVAAPFWTVDLVCD